MGRSLFGSFPRGICSAGTGSGPALVGGGPSALAVAGRFAGAATLPRGRINCGTCVIIRRAK